jgi:hypothetical protein
MVRRMKSGVLLLCLICGSVLAVYAQSPTASPSTGLRASPTLVPPITPVPVLIVTLAVTPTPLSPWPQPLEKAWGTVRALRAAEALKSGVACSWLPELRLGQANTEEPRPFW